MSISSDDMGMLPINSTAVAVDKDKHSHYAVKWAIDHLLSGNNFLILIHVKLKNPDMGGHEADPQHIFIPYRGYCARKMVQVKEVILEDSDVAKAIVDYVSSNFITNVVIGACTRNALVKTFKKPDVPTHVTKLAPEFCSVYVIAKTKVLSVRSAQRPVANTPTPPKSSSIGLSHQLSADFPSMDDMNSRMNSLRGSSAPERLSLDRNGDSTRGGRRDILIFVLGFKFVFMAADMGGHEADPQHIFIPYRGYCARKMVQVKEVILEDSDVAKAIVDYVSSNFITNVVIGACTRNALVKTFKKPDVPTHVTKLAPEFCSVYVIAKTKVLSVRSAQRPVANTPTPPKSSSIGLSHQLSADFPSMDDMNSRMNSLRGSSAPERLSLDRNGDSTRGGRRDILIFVLGFKFVFMAADMGGHEADPQHIFIPYRGYCARKMVQVKEVILEDSDVAKAIVDYVSSNFITNVVIGACTRNALVKTFKKPDVPTHVTKLAPEFCSVYVIAKTKVLSVRSAQRPVANTPTPPKSSSIGLSHQLSADFPSMDDMNSRMNSLRGSSAPERLSLDRNGDSTRGGRRGMMSGSWRTSASMDNIELGGVVSNRNSLSDDETSDHHPFRGGFDMPSKDLDFSFVGGGPRREDSQAQNDLEAEMRRLKLELKQTMDMYSTACKEAISAKQKAKEMEELKKLEQSRYSEESTLQEVEIEKAKCKAAMEAAEAAQKLAEKEAQKRKIAELKAKKESEEKNRALTALAQNDVRYRKYTIDEIEAATEKFSAQFKIGEGGYGPVYRGRLDHTPVAIKVLRPDAAQGRRQFQQEVEVLSCMRHPHMVLLLGACPEYGCLVYEYMNNGSLEDRLLRKNGTPPIPWRIRFKIAAEIAIALTFLHQAKPEPLVHRDLKPANILLDRNYVSKISDVGLARLVPPSVANSVTQYHMTSAAGTFCYIDPEYQQTGMLTTKSDVYSFGIMLLQIITAKPAMGLSHHVQRAIDNDTFADMLDPSVRDWPIEEALSFAKTSLKCCELRKRDRPDLATVVLPELCRLRDYGMTEDPNNFFAYQPINHIPIPRPRSSHGSSTPAIVHQRSPHSSQGGSARLNEVGLRTAGSL